MVRLPGKTMQHLLVMAAVSILSGVIAHLVWTHAQIPFVKMHRMIWCLSFPFALFAFSAVSSSVAFRHHRTGQVNRVDGWYSLATIPFIILLISWRNWINCQAVFSVFYFCFIVFRVSGLLWFLTQIDNRDRNRIYPVLFFLISAFTMPFFLLRPDVGNLLLELPVTIVSATVAAVFVSMTTRGVSGITGSKYSGISGILVLVVMLLSSRSSMGMEILVLSALTACAFWIFEVAEFNPRIWFYPAFGAVLFLPPFWGMEYFGISLWAWIASILFSAGMSRERRSLGISGASVLLLAGIVTAFLYQQGNIFSGEFRWQFNLPSLLPGVLLDSRNGLLMTFPFLLFPLMGYIWRIPTLSKRDWISWLGFPIILVPVVLVSLVETGRFPEFCRLIPAILVLLLYTPRYISGRQTTLHVAFLRIVLLFSMTLGLYYFIQFVFSAQFCPGQQGFWDFILARSDLDFSGYFPLFSSLNSSFSPTIIVWSLLLVFVLLVLSLDQKVSKVSKNSYQVDAVFLILVAFILFAAVWATSRIRTWYILPLEKPVVLESGEYTVEVNSDMLASSIKIHSSLAKSSRIIHGEIIGYIHVIGSDGFRTVFPVKAGIDTAEWAYERQDVRQSIRHGKPIIAESWLMRLQNGVEFQANLYESQFNLDSTVLIKKIIFVKQSSEKMKNVAFTVRKILIKTGETPGSLGKPWELKLPENLIIDRTNSRYEMILPENFRYSRLRIVSNLADAAEILDQVPAS